jgi:citrate lyase subunit beta/citryl-CoA lyase
MNGAIGHARSFLFVPGDRMERLPKALGSGAHAVVADLEDAVAPDHKPAARAAIAAAVNGLSQDDRRRMLVRVNAVGTDESAASCWRRPSRQKT